MSAIKKYFKTKKEAFEALEKRRKSYLDGLRVFKMPKGTRHHGMYAVCTYLEYINTY